MNDFNSELAWANVCAINQMHSDYASYIIALWCINDYTQLLITA